MASPAALYLGLFGFLGLSSLLVQAAIPSAGFDTSLLPAGGGLFQITFQDSADPFIRQIHLSSADDGCDAAHGCESALIMPQAPLTRREVDEGAALASFIGNTSSSDSSVPDPTLDELERHPLSRVTLRLPITDVVCDLWGVQRNPWGLFEAKYWFHAFCVKREAEPGEIVAFSNSRDDQVVYMCNHGRSNPCRLGELNSALGVTAELCPDQFGQVYMREWAKTYGISMRGVPICNIPRAPWYENVLRTMYAWNIDWQSWIGWLWSRPNTAHENAWNADERKNNIKHYRLDQGGFEVFKIDPKYTIDLYPPGTNWHETRPFNLGIGAPLGQES